MFFTVDMFSQFQIDIDKGVTQDALKDLLEDLLIVSTSLHSSLSWATINYMYLLQLPHSVSEGGPFGAAGIHAAVKDCWESVGFILSMEHKMSKTILACS